MNKVKKKKQKQTLREFKAWLQGVEELQADNWCPNRDQWMLIREKIDNIIEEKAPKQTTQERIQPPQPPVQYPQPPMPQVQHSSFFPPPPIPSRIPEGNIEMTPAAKKILNPALNGGKIKTPDIDTSDGIIESPFA